MAGNAAEEALILQIDNPSHTDIARISVPAGAAIAIVVYFFATWQMPVLGGGGRVLLGLIVGGWVGAAIQRRLAAQVLNREAAALQSKRDAAEAEVAGQLAGLAKKNDA